MNYPLGTGVSQPSKTPFKTEFFNNMINRESTENLLKLSSFKEKRMRRDQSIVKITLEK